MSSDRSDGGKPGQAGQGAPPLESTEPKPIERSSRGRVVIRSSSHPPGADQQPLDAREHSGARPLPASPAGLTRGAVADIVEERTDLRSKKATPAERPRRRRQIQAAQAERSRQDTPAARPVARKRRRAIDPLATPANNLVAQASEVQSSAAPAPLLDDDGADAAIEGLDRPRSIVRAPIAIAIGLLVITALWLLLRG